MSLDFVCCISFLHQQTKINSLYCLKIYLPINHILILILNMLVRILLHLNIRETHHCHIAVLLGHPWFESLNTFWSITWNLVCVFVLLPGEGGPRQQEASHTATGVQTRQRHDRRRGDLHQARAAADHGAKWAGIATSIAPQYRVTLFCF